MEELPLWAHEGMLLGIRTLRENNGLTLNLALSYSSRQEMGDAMRRIAMEVKAGRLQPEDIDEFTISSHLYTAAIPDPDLLIRTAASCA